ncbi:MAG TPA: S8 family serine peptidase [Pyrinomonadaceae bacterium]|nr:S8 family serine peptidase [Pyrinomonadaceae bacterium]
MRRRELRVGALLLGLGLILVVFKKDDFVPQSTAVAIDPPLVNAPMLNWTSAAPRFVDSTVIAREENFSRVLTNRATGKTATEKVVVEVVKTRSKYPYLRVETHFNFDARVQAWVAQRPIEYVADQVLVELKQGANFTNALAKVEGHVILRHDAGDSTLVLIGLPKPTIDAVPTALQLLSQFRDTFAVVEPHLIRRASGTPNDPGFAEQWALTQINAAAAWDLTTGSPSVVVAVTDSGIDFNHPDLASRVWFNPGEQPGNLRDDDLNGYVDDYRGYNFAYENNDPTDDLSHGTFVSGVIGAVGNNGVGIAGLCWNVRIMPVKIMDYAGLIYSIDLIRGFDYARGKGAKIVNASLGGPRGTQSEADAISRLRAAGVLLVTAAGNDGSNNDIDPMYPASYPFDNIIVATHSDTDDFLTFDSNYGAATVDLAAPGDYVYSAAPGGGYRHGSGSSFAAPHVTGVAALLKAQNPSRSYAAIKSAILSNVDSRPGLRGRVVSGGRLNAYEPLIPRVPLPGALDAPNLVWQSGGNRPWFGQTLSSSDGVDAARCGNIDHGQTSWLQTTVTGPGVLWFYWRVSSEDTADFLKFLVDGQPVYAISGETPWAQEVIGIPAGNHTLRWTYNKDATIIVGEDKGWVDQVLYLRDTGGPTITVTSPSSTSLTGSDVLMEGTIYDLFGVDRFEGRVSNANGVGPWQPIINAHVDGSMPWQFQLSNLPLGTNVVRLRAFDAFNQMSATNITYIVLSPLTVNVSGCGSVQTRFAGATWQEAGKTLTIRATPCAGSLFNGWTGDIPSSNAVLSFVMRPNLTLQANFAPNLFAPAAGSYSGLFHETAGVLHESSGLVRLSLTDTGIFSGFLTLDGGTNNISGRFDPLSGSTSFSVARTGKSALQFSLQLDFADQLTGQVSDGRWTADLIADRRVFSATNPTPSAGMYTLVFPGAADYTASPSGHGFATATLEAAGRVSVDGRMGDNTRIQQLIPISKNGDWPLYAPLYAANGGSVLSWLKFLSPPGLTNQLTSWIRRAMPTASYYRSGFSNELSAIGSPYSVPAGTRVINCTNALLIFNGADFATPITNNIVLNANNTVQNLGPQNVSMSIVVTNGTFSGSLMRPARTNTFRGVFLQEQNIGLGYFLGSNYIGEVRFEPGP